MVEHLLPGNSPRDLFQAMNIALALLFLLGVMTVLARRRFRTVEEGAPDRLIPAMARRTRLFLLLIPILYVAARPLVLPFDVRRLLWLGTSLCLIAQSALWSIEIVDFLFRRERASRVKADPAAVTTIAAFRIAAHVAVWSIAVIVCLDNLGVEITTLITGLGIGGVAVALAVQNILGDVFASLSIILDKPFVVGDTIGVGTDVGTVERIGVKTTRLRSVTGEQLIFGNGELLKSRIRNFARMDERRGIVRFGVPLATPIEKLEQIPRVVRQIMEADEHVRFDRGHLAAIGESSFEYEFAFYVRSPDYGVFMDAQQRITLETVRAVEAAGIEFARPSRTIYHVQESEPTT